MKECLTFRSKGRLELAKHIKLGFSFTLSTSSQELQLPGAVTPHSPASVQIRY